MQESFFRNFNREISRSLGSIDDAQLIEIARLVEKTCQARKKVILVGNGGSASIASHVSVDLTKSAGCRSITFNEPDLLTCFANDYGYEKWVEKALDFYAEPGDLAILISSSGKSPNIINGALRARHLGLSVVTLSGFSPDDVHSTPLR